MARPLRMERVGAWYHVTARGTERRVIFADDRDRRRWMELVAEAVAVFNLVVHGYVLMDNHYHLMVQTREANLSRAMQWLQTRCAGMIGVASMHYTFYGISLEIGSESCRERL